VPYQASNTAWKATASINASPTSKATWTSNKSSPLNTMPYVTKTLVTTAAVDQEVHPKGEVMLPPEQVDKLLPWYMWWSNELATEMHRRHLVWNEAHRLTSSSLPCNCSCDSEWQCEPHNACFIHDSCFCPGSSSFLPVKPPHMSLLSPPL